MGKSTGCVKAFPQLDHIKSIFQNLWLYCNSLQTCMGLAGDIISTRQILILESRTTSVQMFCSTMHSTPLLHHITFHTLRSSIISHSTPLLHHITSFLSMTLFTCFSISWEFGMSNWRLSLECPSSEEFCSQKNCFIHNLCIHVDNYNQCHQFSYILRHTDNACVYTRHTDSLAQHACAVSAILAAHYNIDLLLPYS